MKFNLWKFVQDAGSVSLFQYSDDINQYRYDFSVFLGVILALGMLNAVFMQPIFGNSVGVMGFGLVMAILKWLLLTRSVTAVLHFFDSSRPRIPFLGYVLLTEGLYLPLILLPYVNFKSGLTVLEFWYMWVSVGQFMGFMRIGQQSPVRVMMAYALYYVLLLFFGSLMMGLFMMEGWLDADVIMQQFQAQFPEEYRILLKNK